MTDPKTFDFLDFIGGGRTYPTDEITVYLDEAAAYELHKIEKQIANETDAAKVDELDAQRKAHLDAIAHTSMRFTLKGLPDDIRSAVNKATDAMFGEEPPEDQAAEKSRYGVNAMFAAHIVSVTNAKGETADATWDAETVGALFKVLPEEETIKCLNAMSDLTFKARYLEDVEVTPDFSLKS